MIIGRIDISAHNCIGSIQMHVCLDFIFDFTYVEEPKDITLGNS